MRIELAGRLDTALTHFAMVGLAGILTESGAAGVRVWWQDASHALATVQWEGPPVEEAVLTHAKRHTSGESWVQATTPGRSAGLFSPRQTFPVDREGWAEFMAVRSIVLDSKLTELDWRMIGGLGEPGHWLFMDNKPRPDAAASRWEMIPRFRGDDFVSQRLAPLARIVAAREPASILSGLTGTTMRDELGKDETASRTGTGLCPPQPVDNAIAWCALWGLSCFPVVPRATGIATTPGAAPLGRNKPESMTLPVWDTPVTGALWRIVTASQALGALTPQRQGEEPRAVDEIAMAVQSLRYSGVLGLVQFPVRHTDNASSPERQIMAGSLVMLDEFVDQP